LLLEVMIAAVSLVTGGCNMLTARSQALVNSVPLLPNWSVAAEKPPAIDLETLRPGTPFDAIRPGDLLEVTVWDLHEVGQPHTFPVRVSPQHMITAPLLGDLPATSANSMELETALISAYRESEILNAPRVVVRRLDAPQLDVQVSGAVVRSGRVPLPRDAASVHAALSAAGGLGPKASTRIGVRRAIVTAAATTGPSSDSRGVEWFDISQPDDLAKLKAVQLSNGDSVIVAAFVPPYRVTGMVESPGKFPVPPAGQLPLRDALTRAGGVSAKAFPAVIHLLHPSGPGGPARRWMHRMETADDPLTEAPAVEPGDLVHVESTAGRKLQRAVNDLWPVKFDDSDSDSGKSGSAAAR
jgi:protein involved in polysaccharide export with SLBB domain